MIIMAKGYSLTFIDLESCGAETASGFHYIMQILTNFRVFTSKTRNKGFYIVGSTRYFPALKKMDEIQVDPRPLLEVLQSTRQKKLNVILVHMDPAKISEIRTIYPTVTILCIPPLNFDYPSLKYDAPQICFFAGEYLVAHPHFIWFQAINFRPFMEHYWEEMKNKKWNTVEEFLVQEVQKYNPSLQTETPDNPPIRIQPQSPIGPPKPVTAETFKDLDARLGSNVIEYSSVFDEIEGIKLRSSNKHEIITELTKWIQAKINAANEQIIYPKIFWYADQIVKTYLRRESEETLDTK